MGYPKVLGVLGGDILMKYKAVIDYGKGLLKLKTGTINRKRTFHVLK
jgi:hypothetical protein